MAKKNLVKIVGSEKSSSEGFEKNFVQTHIATPLRYLAGGLYAAGAGTFFLAGGGFGLTGLGVGASALADLIDSYSYAKKGYIGGRGLGAAWGENVLWKPLAYLPIGTGLIDLYRGHSKFGSRLEEKAEEPRNIKLEDLRDERYAKPRRIAA